MHYFIVFNQREVQQNTIHNAFLLEASIIVNKTDNINAATENRNLSAKTGNGNNHGQNNKIGKKKLEQEKDKIANKEQKKENQLSHQLEAR